MKDSVKEILLKVQNGELSADDALLALKSSLSRIWVTLTSTITARCGKGRTRSFTAAAKPRNRLRGLSGICFPTG